MSSGSSPLHTLGRFREQSAAVQVVKQVEAIVPVSASTNGIARCDNMMLLIVAFSHRSLPVVENP